MVKINKTYNLSEYWNAREDADLNPSYPESINENIKAGIIECLHEASEKASQLVRNWKTLSNQQLHDLLTSLDMNVVSDSEHDPDDMKPLEIPIDDYVINFLEVYAIIRKTTPEQALMKFYVYGSTFAERHGHAQTEIDP